MAVSPPRPKDLALSALRAFEAAGRLGSFALAAAELGVTPGAVTAHVRTLEAALGATLFERDGRGVRLTAAAARAVPEFSTAFDALGAAVQILRAEAAPRVVHIATLPALAQLWLSPRLPALRAAAPEIEISITAMEAPPNLKRTPYDLSLFYGETGQMIATDEIFPVCSPALAAKLHRPEDLSAVTCLTDASWAQDWQIWADAAMPGVHFSPRGPVFSLYALALEEAAGGAGVLMAHRALVATHLAAGALVAPFQQRVTLPRGLRLWSARPMRAGSAVQRAARFLEMAAARI
ncbi:LysR family transcriptional regulator [Cypionkella aquatica]|uniref:LysR family transcriptional regulator n=1 Tax=Cypionkella aquatica TaxID=1756042 RepID=A0AA37U7G2_9RHOB|nr:LysR family transcriptional regulator [Cypionkella aquatica]GLS88135.1 LysR family transcriptional regulator [Cypionkella aquatica]